MWGGDEVIISLDFRFTPHFCEGKLEISAFSPTFTLLLFNTCTYCIGGIVDIPEYGIEYHLRAWKRDSETWGRGEAEAEAEAGYTRSWYGMLVVHAVQYVHTFHPVPTLLL